jgi:hypothetical protein
MKLNITFEKLMTKIKYWIEDRTYDVYFWWQDKPIRKLWRGILNRVRAIWFCLLLLGVAVYSPKMLREVILNSLDKK